MSEEVNKIIDNLCEKLHCTVTELAPEMAKYEITTSIMSVITAIVLVILIWTLLKWFCKRCETDYNITCEGSRYKSMFAVAYKFAAIPIVVGIFIGFIFVIIAVSSLCNIAGWIASPQAALVREVLKLVS